MSRAIARAVFAWALVGCLCGCALIGKRDRAGSPVPSDTTGDWAVIDGYTFAQRLFEKTKHFRTGRFADMRAADFKLRPAVRSQQPLESVIEIRMPMAVANYVREDNDQCSFSITADVRDGAVILYHNTDLLRAVDADLEQERVTAPELTIRQAVERAKEYVIALRGSFPEDLVLTHLHAAGIPVAVGDAEHENASRRPSASKALWSMQFTRYSGAIPYVWEGITLSFSEEYGVARYASYYFDKWEGTVLVGPDEALRLARRHLAHYREPKNIPGVTRVEVVKDNVLVLERPPYLKEGRPTLMHVVPESPRTVHAVWLAIFPYAIEPSTRPGTAIWRQWEVHVDAETGALVSVCERPGE